METRFWNKKGFFGERINCTLRNGNPSLPAFPASRCVVLIVPCGMETELHKGDNVVFDGY